mmetsp:Transcript_18088/g.53990  ORF Transcript_18088/g.53990 Transcript_18088/m.53990 type:complete len:327 (-) Transcript_18088:697-1677(-)
MHASETLLVREEGHVRHGDALLHGIGHRSRHAGLAPGAPLHRDGRLPECAPMPRQAVEVTIRPGVVHLSRIAIHRVRGKGPEEPKARVLVSFQGVVQVQRGARLAAQGRVHFLPCLVLQHCILKNAGCVYHAHEVGGAIRHELVDGLLLCHIALHVLYLDVKLGRLLHHCPPRGPFPVANHRGSGKQLHLELHALTLTLVDVLAFSKIEQVFHKDLRQGAIPAGDGDDALAGDFELGPVHDVLASPHLAHHVATAVQDAQRVLAECLDTRQVGGDLGDAVVVWFQVDIYVLQRDVLELDAQRVGHAPERRRCHHAHADLSVLLAIF